MQRQSSRTKAARTGRTEELSAGASEGDEPLHLAYWNGAAYYSAAGRIWIAPEMNLDRAEAVNDCPTGGENACAEVLGDGRMLLWDENAVVLRSLIPGASEEVRLLVRDYAGVEALDAAVYDLAGRCCESGDIIQPAVKLPIDTRRGDHIAVCTTGAYNYSMASNYNRLPRPPVVMLSEEGSRVAVRRETLEDLVALDQ